MAPPSQTTAAGPEPPGVLPLDPAADADEHFFSEGLTDGLPIVVPTRARVAAMLRGTALQAHEVIGRCPPSYADVVVEKLAIAAVMAGCTPEMFRIVVAAARAMLSPEFNIHGVHATTMGATPVVVVNGECRHAAKVNFKHAPCGSGSRSTSIGRALKLLIQNVGRARLAGTESTTIGTPTKFGMCFAEWEERASMWEPLAVASGAARRDEDAVTVFAVTSGPVQLWDHDATPSELLDRLARIMAVAYAAHIPFVNHALLVVSPEHYDTLVKAGMHSKADLARELWLRTARLMLPQCSTVVQMLGRSKFPSVPGFVWRVAGAVASLAVRVAASLGAPVAAALPKFSSPDSFRIVVAGGDAGKISSFLPSFGVGKPGMPTHALSTPVARPVEPPPPALAVPPPAWPAAAGDPAAVLDPVARRPAEARELARRTGDLATPVALIDISKFRGAELLNEYEARLGAAGVATKRFSKPTFSQPCPDALLKEIAGSCGSAIVALAD